MHSQINWVFKIFCFNLYLKLFCQSDEHRFLLLIKVLYFRKMFDFLGFSLIILPVPHSLVIAFIKDVDTAFVWHGYVLAVSLFLVAQLKTFLLQQYFHYCYSTGMRLRTAIIGLVYRKVCFDVSSMKFKIPRQRFFYVGMNFSFR